MIVAGVFILLCISAYLFFWERTLWLWYALVFFGPFTGLVLDFSHIGWVQDIPYINHINAPYADFIALFLLTLAGVQLIVRAFKGHLGWRAEAHSTGWHFFWPFLLIAFLSIVQVDPEMRLSSLKYFFRPILFFYLIWIVMPEQIVVSKVALKRSLIIFFITGVIAAMMGLLSLFVHESAFGFLTRATPLGWGSWFPFGWNQNLLAEVLVATAPLAGYFMLRAENVRARKWYFLSFVLITAIALLTFSRAAWIALIVEGIVYVRFYTHLSLRTVWRSMGMALVVLAPLVLYMIVFIQSPVVTSSNATRLDLTGIAWNAFTHHPLLGSGVGSFVPIVEDTRVFTLEYGDPLDAHGVLQKLIAEVGVFGTIAFGVFVGWCLRRVWRVWHARPAQSSSRALMACLFLSALGSFVFQLFNTSYYGAHLWLPVGLALTAARIFDSTHV